MDCQHLSILDQAVEVVDKILQELDILALQEAQD